MNMTKITTQPFEPTVDGSIRSFENHRTISRNWIKEWAFGIYRLGARTAIGMGFERVEWIKRLHRRSCKLVTPTRIEHEGFRIHLDPTDALRLSYKHSQPFSLQFLLARLQAGDVVVDVGAHIGYYAMTFSRAVGPAGQVFAVEADPNNYALLKLNTLVNEIENLSAFNFAATENPGDVVLYRSICSAMNRIHPSKHCSQSTIVPARPLDSVDALRHRPIRCIKIDVEGHEVEVLRGATQLLRDNPKCDLCLEFAPAWIKEAGGDPREVFSFLQTSCREIQLIDEANHTVRAVGFEELITRYSVASERGADLWCVRGLE